MAEDRKNKREKFKEWLKKLSLWTRFWLTAFFLIIAFNVIYISFFPEDFALTLNEYFRTEYFTKEKISLLITVLSFASGLVAVLGLVSSASIANHVELFLTKNKLELINELGSKTCSLEKIIDNLSEHEIGSGLITKYSIDHYNAQKIGPSYEGLSRGVDFFWRLQQNGILPPLKDWSFQIKFHLERPSKTGPNFFSSHYVDDEYSSWYWLSVDIKATYTMDFSKNPLPKFLRNRDVIYMILKDFGILDYNIWEEYSELLEDMNIEAYYPIPSSAFYFLDEDLRSNENHPIWSNRKKVLKRNMSRLRKINFLSLSRDEPGGLPSFLLRAKNSDGSPFELNLCAKPLFYFSEEKSKLKWNFDLLQNLAPSELESNKKSFCSLLKNREFINLYSYRSNENIKKIESLDRLTGKEWKIEQKYNIIMPCFADYPFMTQEINFDLTKYKCARYIHFQDSYEHFIGRLAVGKNIKASVNDISSDLLWFPIDAPLSLYSFLPLQFGQQENNSNGLKLKSFNKPFLASDSCNNCNIPFLFPYDAIVFRLRSAELSGEYSSAIMCDLKK